MQQRTVVTGWKHWRDIFASERIINFGPGRYESATLHEWKPWREHGDRDAESEPMRLSSFATVKGATEHVSLDVTLTPQAVEAIGNNILYIDGDTVSLEVIVWEDGQALVVAHHNRIIGGPWLAKIDAMTIPDFTVVAE